MCVWERERERELQSILLSFRSKRCWRMARPWRMDTKQAILTCMSGWALRCMLLEHMLERTELKRLGNQCLVRNQYQDLRVPEVSNPFLCNWPHGNSGLVLQFITVYQFMILHSDLYGPCISTDVWNISSCLRLLARLLRMSWKHCKNCIL